MLKIWDSVYLDIRKLWRRSDDLFKAEMPYFSIVILCTTLSQQMLPKTAITDPLKNRQNSIFDEIAFFDGVVKSLCDDFIYPKMQSLMYVNVFCILNDPYLHYMRVLGIHKIYVYLKCKICGIDFLTLLMLL